MGGFAMYRVKIVEGYMDPGYCTPRNSGAFVGEGRSRSPKTAMRLAKEALRLDYRNDWELASSCPVFYSVEIYRGNRLIGRRGD